MAAIVPGQGGSSTTDHTALSNIGTNTHAQIDTAIGTIFSKVGDTLTGTAGAGFFGAIPQSSAPSTPGSGFRIYANASGLLEWKGTNGFTQTFDGSANTANRAYTLPNSSGTIAVEGSLTTFANPSIQNGYYQFVQTTAPTQRSSGVPLVTGDRWYNPTTRVEAFWNGTYWLTTQVFGPRGSMTFVGSPESFVTTNDGVGLVGGAFVEKLVIQYKSHTTAHDASNYRRVDLNFRGSRNAIDELNLVRNITLNNTTTYGVTYPYPTTSYVTLTEDINQYAGARGDIHIINAASTILAGTPSWLDCSFRLFVRGVLA